MRPTLTLRALMTVLLCTAATAYAADWPTYRGDFRRSGATDETLDAAKLKLTAAIEMPQAPAPPWYGPAKVDAYRNMPGLGDMRNYDRAFGVAVVGDKLFISSNADDTVRCLQLPDRKTLWSFIAGGPVRLAPTVVDQKVYFGSDDGYAYCLNATDGKLIWKVRAAKDDRRILVNNRIASLWPVRTGVVVADGKAYFAAGMLTWEPTYFCAVDAATGKIEGDGLFRREFPGWPAAVEGEAAKALAGKAGLTPEAAMVLYKDRLVVPQGRVAPMLYSRTDGATLGNAPGPGGCFAMLTDDDQWLFAPGNRAGYLCGGVAETNAGTGLIFGGMAAVVDKESMYYITVNSVTAVARGQWATRGRRGRNPGAKWSKPVPDPGAIIRAGTTLFVGGRNKIAAFASADGSELWQANVKGKVYELVAANGWLIASTDAGQIYCFSDKAGKDLPAPQSVQVPAAGKDFPVLGPYVKYTSPTTAIVSWQTAEPAATEAFWSDGTVAQKTSAGKPATAHTAELTGLTRGGLYQVTIVTGKGAHMQFELDTYFNFTAPAMKETPADASAAAAKKLLADSGVSGGLCLVLGSGDGLLACELARAGNLHVAGIEIDAAKVAASRKALAETGAYGSRISIVQVDAMTKFPIVSGCANLIVVNGNSPVPEAEVRRLLAPGGKAVLASGKTIVQPLAKDSGVWTHEYGLPDNSAFGGEALSGARTTDDLAVRWVGRPGPRFQTDRSGRKPSPLAVGGRLFVQGRDRIAALDAYNGTILWSLEIPGIGRMNIPADTSNWCADEGNVYLVVRDRCWQIDAASGKIVRTLAVLPGAADDVKYEWGYIARVGKLLLGTPVTPDAPFKSFWGGAGWYDAWEQNKVCSDTLFAVDPETGKTTWTYRKGKIIHPSIAASDGKIYFVESRNSAAVAAKASRIGSRELWTDTFIVALDAASGKLLWESAFASPGWPGVFYLVAAGDRLVVGTNVRIDGQRTPMYFAMGLKNPGGEKVWTVSWAGGGDHGAHMSHPAVVGGKVYMRPKVINLADGKEEGFQMPGGGCGTYSMTTHAAFYRSGTVQMWPLSAEAPTTWSRLRPDCWISTIPAGGMLLSPEAGGGCSCGSWLEFSTAFGPK